MANAAVDARIVARKPQSDIDELADDRPAEMRWRKSSLVWERP
jgi:hypothetical protein